jgi:very-short-patch-repair endonuclease
MRKSNIERNFTWSDVDKKRISETRLKYLIDHPDKVPYKLNHSSKMSYPEEVFRNALVSMNITGWTYNYQNSIYSYDFAFISLKIDVEIDGGTHLTDKVKLIDERRDKFSQENGWKVIRFTAKEVKRDVMKCINHLNTFL